MRRLPVSDRSHPRAYAEWLARVNDALVAEGRRSLFSFKKTPLPLGRDGEVPDEEGDPMAPDVDAICEKHGIKPFRFYADGGPIGSAP